MKWKKTAAALSALTVGLAAADTLTARAEATPPTTIYVVTSGFDMYYWYGDLALAIWNAEPALTHATLVPAASCPSSTADCITLTHNDPGNANACGWGSWYAPGVFAAGSRGWAVVNDECWWYSQANRITIAVHEIGHALGIGYSTDKSNIMNDTSGDVYNYQVPTYDVYQQVGAVAK